MFLRKFTGKPIHIIFSVVDHYEPFWNKVSAETAARRVAQWAEHLPLILNRFKDSTGNPPKYTFFYPQEEYRKEYLEILADICRQGIGDVEIHLHHDNDTAEGLRQKLNDFKTVLHERHGLLRKDINTGDIVYGFIHGNWALDNSRQDGRMCGVNNELLILRDTGCYADFTFPSAPDETQTSKINSIYYAEDDPLSPKSHNRGKDVEAGRAGSGDLMIIQGPLTLNWGSRKKGIFPRIENGELSGDNPPNQQRIDLWINQHICVKGRPEWLYVKVYTHGTQEKNSDTLLGGGLEMMYSYLQNKYNDGKNFVLHYASSWEMYNIIKAAEAGKSGNPSEYKTFLKG